MSSCRVIQVYAGVRHQHLTCNSKECTLWPVPHVGSGSEQQQEALQQWVIPFDDLQFQPLIGAGSFGRVGLCMQA